jgi:hypothetical protein
VGACKIGQRTCDTTSAWGACIGAVAPEDADTCEPGNDANCNNITNEGCPCENDTKRACGSDEGECKQGSQTCTDAVWGPCVGEVKPEPTDTCDDGNDANCNGSPNNNCTCINGATQACGNKTGNCKQGLQTCVNGVWGDCTGGVLPESKDKCSPANDDANCNGIPNENCDCTAGDTRPCAKCGTQTCGADGKWPVSCDGSKDCEPGDVKTDSIACGNCGTQDRKATCGSSCTYGNWANVGSCLGSGPCAPGVTADQTQTVACGNCGSQKQTRACTAACDWPANWTNSGSCTGSGCVPSTSQAQTSQPCGYCGEQLKEKLCGNDCTYGPTVNKGACIQNECNLMPGDERVGYVTCEWPDPYFHKLCLPSEKCCLDASVGAYDCKPTCAGGEIISECDGPEDCGGSTCCSKFAANENPYTYCTTTCNFNVRCHADSDCPFANYHCTTYATGGSGYPNGECLPNGSAP